MTRMVYTRKWPAAEGPQTTGHIPYQLPLLQSQCPAGFRSRETLRWPGTPLVLGRLESHMSARGPRAEWQQREPETFWDSHFICQIFSKSLSPELHIASYFSPTTLTLTYYRGFKGVSRNEEQHKHIISLTCFKMTLLAVPNSSFLCPIIETWSSQSTRDKAI